MSIKNILTLLLILSSFLNFAQEVILKGKLSDTLQSPLQNANMLAIPEEGGFVFSITDAKGNYKLSLKSGMPYTLEISYLGYQKTSVPINLKENSIKDFTLVQQNESLDEIILNQKLPVRVRKDTITYQTDVFTNGQERKLREVLKKLPGVEVDREGNVTLNGKKVDKLLVEGKMFFTGSTRLGVNNIPADAVAEVEMLDNYSEIPFLKGLNDSNILAMNIKLKEGKKKFAFGDIEFGGGIQDRYSINPNLFYYSPKTTLNAIGDFNNTGQKSFTFQDYMEFEGGVIKVIDDPSKYSNMMNSEFARHLANNDFIFNRNAFGALSASHQLSPKTSVSAYSIINASLIDTELASTNTYLFDRTISKIEKRTTATSADNLFTLSKLTARYIPNENVDLTYDLVLKSTTGGANEHLESLNLMDSNFVASKLKSTSFEVNQNLGYSKRFSYKHTSTINASLNIGSNTKNNDWRISNPVFNDIIPLEGTGPFAVSQTVDSKNHNAAIGIKHYWILNGNNHIYPLLGYNFSNQQYNTIDQQLIDNEINEFGNAGFNNATEFQLSNPYIGFQYKAKLGGFTFKPGLVYHYYDWKVHQFTDRVVSKSKIQLLPEFHIDWEDKNSRNLSFKYNLKSNFNDVSYFTDRLRLQGFNDLYRGNVNLENELAHNLSINYYRFSMFRNVFINAGIYYSKKEKSIQNATIIDGINQINTSFYSSLPENSLNINASFSKKIKKIKYTVAGGTSFMDYSRNVNSVNVDYKAKNFDYTLKTETDFKDLPNVELGFRQTFSDFSSSNIKSKYNKTDPYVNLEYSFLNDFLLKADYTYSLYKNKQTNSLSTFQIGNTSLYYNKEDSSWGFEIEAKNVFDIKYKSQNSFNEYIVTDTQIFIHPRTILFKLSYKF